ncbi:MAG: deoxyribodipyrimidine photo-lyase [Phycisphaerae bacterium]
MVQQERIRRLNNKKERRGKYILYWMQAAQRAEYNHALEYAIEKANEKNLPVLVVFGLTGDYPQANLRHYFFMLEGLRETQQTLTKRGIKMVVVQMRPDAAVVKFSKNANVVIVDGGQLRIQRRWRDNAAKKIECALFEAETNLIVPIEEASDKEEFAARTIRPRIEKKLNYFLKKVTHHKPNVNSLGLRIKGLDISDVKKVIDKLEIDKSVGRCGNFTGGTSQAKKKLRRFIKEKLDSYAQFRNDPGRDYQSDMSPYLHFGQISPLYVAMAISKTKSKSKKDYLEELIIRRELSHNFVYYNKDYDKFDCLEHWSKRTLKFHSHDKREYVYSLEQFEQAKTHDEYWNAAQREMAISGKMHGYMRMYWGKKILEWSKSPEKGFQIAIYLNNKYELDGRDANGFAGVAWCFGKHDQGWPERKVFGKVRYMNAGGLERKFDMQIYLKKVERLEKKAEKANTK